MKKYLLIATVIALLAPVSLMANSIDFAGTGGAIGANGTGGWTTTANGGSASNLTVVDILGTLYSASGYIGTVNFTTGAFDHYNADNTVAYFATGGSIDIASNSLFTDPNDTLFSGVFTQMQSFAYTNADHTTAHFGGWASGTLSNWFQTQFGFPTGASGLFTAGTLNYNAEAQTWQISSLDLSVPEPGTIALLGLGLMGLLGMAALGRKKGVAVNS